MWPGNHLSTDHAAEENHIIDWDKAHAVDTEAQRQTRWIKEAFWIRKTLMCMNRDAGSYQLIHTWDQVISRSRAPSSCKQSRCDQDVQQTLKRCHQVTYFQLCKVRSFYVTDSCMMIKHTDQQVNMLSLWHLRQITCILFILSYLWLYSSHTIGNHRNIVTCLDTLWHV